MSGGAMAPEPETEESCEPEKAPRIVAALDEDGRRTCPSCGRRFNPISFERHQRVCQQVFRSTRPQFDPMKGSIGSSTIGSKVGLTRVLSPKQDSRPIGGSLHAGLGSPSRSPAWSSLSEPRTSAVMRLQSGRAGDRSTTSSLASGLSGPIGTREHAAAAALPASSASLVRPSSGAAARERSPASTTGFESIEEQEQRVMQMLQVQMEELRGLRRRCGQAAEAPLVVQGEESLPPTDAAAAVEPTTPAGDGDGSDEETLSPDQEVLRVPSSDPPEMVSQETVLCDEPPLSLPEGDIESRPANTEGGQRRRLVVRPDGQLSLSTEGSQQSASITAPVARFPPSFVGSSTASSSRASPNSTTFDCDSGRVSPPSGTRASTQTTALDSDGVGSSSSSSLNTRGLKICEDCGRRFNPSSFEKHRAVCRSVFGKPRTPFESQIQRMASQRSLASREQGAPSPQLTVTAVSCAPQQPAQNTRGEVPFGAHSVEVPAASSSAPKPLSRKVGERLPLKSGGSLRANYATLPGSDQEMPLGSLSPGTNPGRRLSPTRPLQTCPFCGRSFRAAAFDTHTKVCQSVFPSHEKKEEQKYVYDSRRHRLKGTAFETYSPTSPSSPSLGDFGLSATPPLPPRSGGQESRTLGGAPPPSNTQGRGPSRSPKMQLRRSASESLIPTSSSARSASPGNSLTAATSPTADEASRSLWSREDRFSMEARQSSARSNSREAVASDLASRVAGLPIRMRSASPHETHERPGLGRLASSLVSEPGLRSASSHEDSATDLRTFFEDRRGRLERARFGMKMGQRPEYSPILKASTSEQALRGTDSYENGGILGDSSWRPSSVRRRSSHQLPIAPRSEGPERRSTQPPEVFSPHERVEVCLAGSPKRGLASASPGRDSSPGILDNRVSSRKSLDRASRSQPLLYAPGLDPLPSVAAPPPPMAHRLASAERRGRSPLGDVSGGDFRSYYERCLEHLDSIGTAASPAPDVLSRGEHRRSEPIRPLAPPASPNLSGRLLATDEQRGSTPKRVKPGLAREDPAAEPSQRLLPRPSQSSERSAAILRGAPALTSAEVALASGGRTRSPRSLTPPRAFGASASHTTLLAGVARDVAGGSRERPRIEALTRSLQASVHKPIRELRTVSASLATGSTSLVSHASPIAATVLRPAPVRMSSAVSIGSARDSNNGVYGALMETPISSTTLCAANAGASAAYIVPRAQYVPRLDLRQINQHQERLRSSQPAGNSLQVPAGNGLQVPLQKAASLASRQLAR